MKLHELLKEINLLYLKDTKTLNYDVVIEDIIGGFMHDAEAIKIENDQFNNKLVVSIQFRSQ